MRAVTLGAILALATAADGSAQVSTPQPVPPATVDIVAKVQNAPTAFVPVPEADPVPYGDRVCPIEFRDPRDGTTLRLVRSVSAKITSIEGDQRVTRDTSYGDYVVPVPNPYGVEAGRALRVDCVTAAPIGLVVRFTEANQ